MVGVTLGHEQMAWVVHYGDEINKRNISSSEISTQPLGYSRCGRFLRASALSSRTCTDVQGRFFVPVFIKNLHVTADFVAGS